MLEERSLHNIIGKEEDHEGEYAVNESKKLLSETEEEERRE